MIFQYTSQIAIASHYTMMTEPPELKWPQPKRPPPKMAPSQNGPGPKRPLP